MSEIINPTEPVDSSPLPDGGLDIRGFEDRENELSGSEESDSITGGNLADLLSGLAGDDTIEGLDGNDTIFGGEGDDLLSGGDGNDSLEGNLGSDTLEGGAGQDLLIVSGGGNVLTGGSNTDSFEINVSDLVEGVTEALDEITDYQAGEKIVIKNNTPASEVNYDPETGTLSLDEQEVLQLSTGLSIDENDIEFVESEDDDTTEDDSSEDNDTEDDSSEDNANTIGLEEFLNDPSEYMDQIRDFDGNDLGSAESWKRIGAADVQGDGDDEQVFVNPDIERWATVGADENDRIDFSDYGEGGDTRVVGIYIDPQVEAGLVERGSDFDSQRRFQNDLAIDNLSLIEDGDDDFDGDGLQEVYFEVNDGTSVLHALMHADGNIQYANYQSAEDLEQFMTENGIDNEIWEDWI